MEALNVLVVTTATSLLWLVLVVADILLTVLVILFGLVYKLPFQIVQKWFGKTKKEEKSFHCVIIGYSFGGMNIHHMLENDETNFKNWKFTIIEPKSYFEFTPSIPDCVVNPNKFHSLSLPIYKIFNAQNSNLLQGYAISMDKNSVTVQLCPSRNGNDKNSITLGAVLNPAFSQYYEKLDDLNDSNDQIRINFDYCLIASGSKYSSPIKDNITDKYCNLSIDRRFDQFNQIYNVLQSNNTNDIIIIGAGPAGVELLAALLHRFPNKRYSIIDKNCDLCHQFPLRSREYIGNYLSKYSNVKCILNATITDIKLINNDNNDSVGNKYEIDYFDNTTNISDSNSTDNSDNSETVVHSVVTGDYLFQCLGFQPNTEFLFEHNAKNTKNGKNSDKNSKGESGIFDACCMEQGKNKFIKVNYNLETNISHVLGLGDVIYYPLINEVKLVHMAELHCDYIHYYLTCKEKETETKDILPYHEWLLDIKITEKERKHELFQRLELPLAYSISLGNCDGTMGFANLMVVNGFISAIFKWYIEWSKFLGSQVGNYWNCCNLFKIYPLGFRINEIAWYFGDKTYIFFSKRWLQWKYNKDRKLYNSKHLKSKNSNGNTNRTTKSPVDKKRQ